MSALLWLAISAVSVPSVDPGDAFLHDAAAVEGLRGTGDPLDAQAAVARAATLVERYGRLRYEALEPMWSDYRSVRFDKQSRLRAERNEKVGLLHQLEAGYGAVASA